MPEPRTRRPPGNGVVGDLAGSGEHPVLATPVLTPPVLVNASAADEPEGVKCIEFAGNTYTAAQAKKIARDLDRACSMVEVPRTLRGFDE